MWYVTTQIDYNQGYWVTLVSVSISGMISIGVYSSAYEYVVDLSPGIGESISAGLINSVANTLGFLEIEIIQYLAASDKDQKNYVFYAMAVLLGLLIPAFIM